MIFWLHGFMFSISYWLNKINNRTSGRYDKYHFKNDSE